MGARNSKETPPYPSFSGWTKKASLYKHTETPGKDGKQKNETKKKSRKKRKNILRYESPMEGLMTFNELTTCHGPHHVLRNRGTYSGWLWAFITVLLGCSLTIINTRIVVTFFNREVQSQTTMETATRTGLPLPSIILCNRGFFSKAKLEAQGISNEIASYIIVSLFLQSLVNAKHLKSGKGDEMLGKANDELHAILEERNITVEQLINSISYSCEEIILQCLYADIYNSSACCEQLIPVATVSGVCYYRHAGPDDRQSMNGEYGGFTIYVKLPMDDLMEFVPEIIDVTQLVKVGIQVTVTSNLSYPGYLVMGQGTILTPHELTSIRLSLTQIDRRGVQTYIDVYDTPCVWSQDLGPILKTRDFLSTSVTCIDGAFFKCYSELCDCYNFAFDNKSTDSVRICSLDETITCSLHLGSELSKLFQKDLQEVDSYIDKNLSALAGACLAKELNSCSPICKQINYGHDSEVSALRPELLRDVYRDFQLDENKTSISVVTIFFPTMDYGSIKEWRLSPLDLLSDIGGYMGLFLGCSLITMTEFSIALLYFFYWLCDRLFAYLRPRPHAPTNIHRIRVSIAPVYPR